MTTDSASVELPQQDDALAALMASPAFQAQMAALTQQAVASLQALVAALAQADSQLQLPLVPPVDVPPVTDDAATIDPALAALLASPEYQAQIAALTQQAAASVRILATDLGAIGGPGPVVTTKLVDPVIDIPYGLAVEPMFLPWSTVPQTSLDSGFIGPAVPHLSTDPLPAEYARDMLAVLPKAAAAIEVEIPAMSGGASDTPAGFNLWVDLRAGGEAGTG